MPKIQVDEIDFDVLADPQSGLVTQSVTDNGAHSLKMACHALTEGHELQISKERVSHVIYVWRGNVEVSDQQLPPGTAIAVEVGSELILRAMEDALLVDFYEREPNTSNKAGGHIHIVRGDEIRGGEDDMGLGFHASYLDSDCPSCDVWLHESRFPPDREITRHYHTEDEIIFIRSGELHLGRRILTPGTALAIAANTPYGFKVGKEGLTFVNFRAMSPTIVLFFEGKGTKVLDEARAIRELASKGTTS